MHGDRVVRGTIGDQPWGWTLGALGVAQRTVRVVLRADDKEYRITFDRGAVVAASSPMAVDSVARVALTNHLIAPILVNEIKRRLAAAPNLDEVDVLVAAANIDPDAAHKLRRRLLTQRAARTFAVDRGDFEIADCEPTASAATSVDIRAVIFIGARMNLSEDRLRFGLRKFGPRFVLRPGVSADTLDRFDFTPKEQPLLASLRSPTSLAELEASHREVDPRAVQAVVYALASCGALAELDLSLEVESTAGDSDLAIPLAPPPPPFTGRVPTATLAPGQRVTERVRAVLPREPSPLPSETAFEEPAMAQGTPGVDKPASRGATLDDAGTFEGPLTRTIASLELEEMRKHPAEAFDEPPPVLRALGRSHDSAVPVHDRSMIETFKTGRVTSIRPNALKAREVVALILERTELIARGADHFTLLGVAVGAPIEDIHAAYVELQRNLGAKRLRELGISDSGLLAEGVLAQAGIAFTVLTDRIRRTEYIATLAAHAGKPTRSSR